MNPRLKSVLRVGVSLLLAFLFLYLAFRGSDFDKLISSLKEANYLWAFLLIPCLMISHLFRAWRWKYLVRPIKKNVSVRNLFSSLMVGYMVNNALPRVGEIVRCYNLGKLERISMGSTLGTVLVERIIDILSLLFLLTFVVLFYPSSLIDVFPWLKSAGIIGALFVVLAFAVIGLMIAKREHAFRWIRKFTGRLSARVSEKIERLLHSLLDGFLIIKEPRQYSIIILLSIVIWFWYAVMAYLPFYAFGMAERFHLDFVAGVVTVVISAIAFVIPAPGGTGSYHWLAKETLVRVFGVDAEVALSYATVTHLLGFVSVSLVGFFYFLRDNLKFSEAIRSPAVDKTGIEFMPEEKV